MRLALLSAFVAALFASTVAEAAPNVPLCFAIANNYNACVRNQQRRAWMENMDGWGGPQYGYDDEYGHGYGYGRHRRHHGQGDCAVWLVQMQANHCM